MTTTAHSLAGRTDVDVAESFEYALPSLGADMETGRVTEWRVAIGDTVRRGDVVAIVETEKSDIDIEIWRDGIVEQFLVPVGEEIAVGTPIARLRRLEGGSTSAAPTTGGAPDTPAPAPSTPPLPPPGMPDASAAASTSRIASSPLARRTATDLGVDLASIHGTGPGGAVVVADVLGAERAVEPTSAPPAAPAEEAPVSGMRRLIAERMTRANREIPHYHLARDVDVGDLLGTLSAVNAERPVRERLLPAAAYVRALALAAARHRELNGFWGPDGFEPGDAVNVAVAVALRTGGLVIPCVEDADQRSLDEIMATMRTLVAEARRGTLRSRWMSAGTITLTNLGDQGADLVHGVISPPQVALVGTGRILERAWVVDGAIVPRPILTVTLAADHRATDGVTGSRFLDTLAHALEHPEEL